MRNTGTLRLCNKFISFLQSITIKQINQIDQKERLYLTPGVRVGGLIFTKSRICVNVGCIIPRRTLRDSWNVIDPDMALAVLWEINNHQMIYNVYKTYKAATSSPLLQNLASSSMPSSCITVESTSKHTASACFRIFCTSALILPLKRRHEGSCSITVAVYDCSTACLP